MALTTSVAVCQMNTGLDSCRSPFSRAWVTYGLGRANENLPSFVILTDERKCSADRRTGVPVFCLLIRGRCFGSEGAPILDLAPPDTIDDEQQRSKLNLLTQLNRFSVGKPEDSDLEARISSYELAYRMQKQRRKPSISTKESEATKKLYGLDEEATAKFGTNCLLARRLVERGVRFIELYCGSGSAWDAHNEIEANHSELCVVRQADRRAVDGSQSPRLAGRRRW